MAKIADYYRQVAETVVQIPREPVEEIVRVLQDARLNRRRVFSFGNGGSAATASHLVTDMVKGLAALPGPRMNVTCLNDNLPMLMAYANDVRYDAIFCEPLVAMAQSGDVALAISGSGNSPNVLQAMETARALGLTRIGLTGYAGGKLKDLCDPCVIVPSDSMQVIEDLHLVILHSVLLAMGG